VLAAVNRGEVSSTLGYPSVRRLECMKWPKPMVDLALQREEGSSREGGLLMNKAAVKVARTRGYGTIAAQVGRHDIC